MEGRSSVQQLQCSAFPGARAQVVPGTRMPRGPQQLRGNDRSRAFPASNNAAGATSVKASPFLTPTACRTLSC